MGQGASYTSMPQAAPAMWGGASYTSVSQVDSREASVDWRDPVGDRISFRLNDGNGVDLLVNGDLKVQNLSGVRVDGRSLIVDGTGTAGTVVGSGRSAAWVVVVPDGQDVLITRVIALFQRRQEVPYRGWRLRPALGYWGHYWTGYWLGSYSRWSPLGWGYGNKGFGYVPGRVMQSDPSAAEACCMPEAEGVSTGFSYVGEGRGSYQNNSSYIYVGEGAGDHNPTRGPKSCFYWCSCILLISVVAVVIGLGTYTASHWGGHLGVTITEWDASTGGHITTSFASPHVSPHFSITNCSDAIYHKERVKSWSEEHKVWCCSSVGVGCSTTMGPAPVDYDCLAGYSNWVAGWSASKKAWCCKNQGRGCPVTSTSKPYNCEDGLAYWQRDWPDAKMSWCCSNEGKGCNRETLTTATLLPYDCNDDSSWSIGKKAWCCLHAGRMCPTTTGLPYDCEAGFNNWEKGWSQGKKLWCCAHASKGCPTTTTSLPYDCDAGFNNWERGWSRGKKIWCCQHENRGCTPKTTAVLYDCRAGFNNWEQGWSQHKKTWCCINDGRGCSTTTTAEAYDCMAGLANWRAGWSSAKKKWCCDQTGNGCPVLATTTSLPYDCQAGLNNWHRGWSHGKKEWCCAHEKLGCYEALACDLNCFGPGADFVLLHGAVGEGEGAFVPRVTRQQCAELCKQSADCEAIEFRPENGGQCYGKKNIHTGDCQPGGGFVTEMMPGTRPWGKCAVFGDPHLMTWDRILGPATRQFDQGDYWLVKAPEVRIQGRFGFTHRFPNASSTLGVALGGPLLQGHTLIVEYVGAAFGHDGFKVTWDGQEILQAYPSGFEAPDKVLRAKHEAMDPLKFHREGRHTIGGTEADGDLPSYLFEFPQADLNVYVLKGPDNCNAVLEMKRLNGGEDGYCGNFNCDVADDSTAELRKRGLADPIPPGESLFGAMPQWRQDQAVQVQKWLAHGAKGQPQIWAQRHASSASPSEEFTPEITKDRQVPPSTVAFARELNLFG